MSTRREIAERVIREWVEHGLDEHYEPRAEFPVTMPPDDLIERFEQVLRDRDERAAKIAENYGAGVLLLRREVEAVLATRQGVAVAIRKDD